MDRKGLLPNANVIPSRFSLAIKNVNDGNESLKARFVLGGHRDNLEYRLCYKATSLRHSVLLEADIDSLCAV